MKAFLLISILVLSACKTIDQDFQSAIAFGEIEELNKLNPKIEKQLFIRLYKSPIYLEGCFIETHGICQFNYFLTVSTFDEYPETNIYKLKTRGEITDITWLSESKVDTAKLRFFFTKYTDYAMKNNDSLNPEKKSVLIEVSKENLSEVFEEAQN